MTGSDVPRRVMVRAPNWLGDLVMALPTLVALRAHFSSSAIAVAVPQAFTPLLEASPDIGEPMALTGDYPADIRVIADGQFDVGILLTNSFRSAWMLRRAGVRERWGYRRDWRGWLLTRSVAPPRRREGVLHQSVYYKRLVERLGVEVPEGSVRLAVTPAMQRRARAAFDLAGVDANSLVVGFAPGAAYGHAKRWPPGRFAELIRAVGRERGVTAMLVGGATDRDAAAEIESVLSDRPPGREARSTVPIRVVNLVGQTDLPTFMGVLASCRAFVSNDSGAMHVASALGVPVVALFGPTDKRATAPVGPHSALSHPVWCRPCHLRECPIDHRCMKRISVERVLESLGSALDRPAA